MIGATSMEYPADVRVQATTLDELYAQFGADAAAARRIYAGTDLQAIAAKVAGDQGTTEPALAIARILSARDCSRLR